MKNKRILLGLSLAGLAIAIAAIMPISRQLAISSETNQWSNVEIKDNYLLNDVIELPSRTYTYNNEVINAEVRLIYPNGTAIRKTSTSKTAALDVAGNYSLEFIAKDKDSIVHKDTIHFAVLNKLWSYSNQATNAKYGLGNYATPGNDGLLIRLAKGDTLHFNKVIDLNNIDINTSIVSGFITPDVRGAYDFDRLFFKFTDISDENNYLIYAGRRSLSSSWWQGSSYWTAASEGQTLTGFESGKNIYHTGDIWGTPLNHSWVAQSCDAQGQGVEAPSNRNPFALSLDPTTNMVYVSGSYVTDLDDACILDGAPSWKGFKTNKVTLDVYCDDYMATTANFCLTKVLGYDLSLEDILFKDEEAPVITVDNSENVIDEVHQTFNYLAVKGGNYSVPNATALDSYAKQVDVKTHVYYNYDNPSKRIQITVKDNKFPTNYIGEYTVVYSASDFYNNIGEVKYSLMCVESLDDPLGIELDMEGVKTNDVHCGEQVSIAKATLLGGSGPKTLKVTASCGNEKLAVEDGYFLPEVPGNWTVRYVSTDYSGIVSEKAYKVNVTASDVPYFVDAIELPKYFVNNKQHLVPTVFANDYSSGKVNKVLADITIKDAKGEKSYKPGDIYKPSISENLDEVSVTFKAGGNIKTINIPTVKSTIDGEFFVENMFVGNGFDREILDDRLNLKASNNESFETTYASMFLAENSFVSFRTLENGSSFDSIEVTFTDAYNKNLSVTATLTNRDSAGALMKVNDTEKELLANFLTPNTEFAFAYKDGAISSGNISFDVTHYDNGLSFNGFPSKRVYISLKVNNPSTGSGIAVNKIDNATISSIKIDLIKPRIEIEGEHGGVIPLNTVITIPSILASDNVDQYVPTTVTVTNENGEIIKDVNGLLLEDVSAEVSYDVLLNRYGTCQVDYSATDSSKKKGVEEITYVVIDTEAPKISITGNYKEEVSVGTKVTLPAVHISDDNTSVEELIAYRTVRVSTGRVIHIGDVYTLTVEGKVIQYAYEYTFETKGKYTFTIHAMDKAGNYSSISYTVICK